MEQLQQYMRKSKILDFFVANKSKTMNLRLFITAWIWRFLA